MKILVLNIPKTADLDSKEVLMIMASKLYERGSLSLGQAAEITGLSKRSFLELLSRYEVSVFNYPVSDIDRDIENIKRYTN